MNGVECTVRCFQDVLRDPPPIGSMITVKHAGIYNSTGMLKQPIFWRERKDIQWNSFTSDQKKVKQHTKNKKKNNLCVTN